MDKKILTIDDERDTIEFIKSILEDEDYTIITASNGIDGLKIAKGSVPDLIILDVQMPKKDGFSTFIDLKKDEKTKKIPIIMLTGIGDKVGMHFSKKDMGEYMGSEPEFYLEKPIDPEKLLNIVKKVFE